jgi:Holliday junction resolvase RusA-like endonuclease
MRVLRIELPLPPSANAYWRPAMLGNGKMTIVPTKVAKQYRKDVKDIFERGTDEPIAGAVDVHLWVFFPTIAGDLDNRVKVTLDALRGFAFPDDNRVAELHVYRRKDPDRPRILVEVVGKEAAQGLLEIASQRVNAPKATPAYFKPRAP